MPIDIEAPFVINAVRIKARNLKTYRCFSDMASDDIEADLFVHLWEAGLALPSEHCSEPAFIHALLNRKAVDMLRHRMSIKELARCDTESLDAMQVTVDILPSRAPGIVDEVAFQTDFAGRLSLLSEELRMIVEKMRQGYSHADIAREMNLSRKAFHRKYATFIQKSVFPEWYVKLRKMP